MFFTGKAPTPKFLMVGASLTAGLNEATFQNIIDSRYSVRSTVINRGIGGWDSLDLRNNIQSILDDYTDIDYVIFEIGGNDVTTLRPWPAMTAGQRTTYENNIRASLDAIVAKGWDILPWELTFRNYGGDTITNEAQGSLPFNDNVNNPVYFEYAPSMYYSAGNPLAQTYKLIKDNYTTFLQVDNIHLSAAGNTAVIQHLRDTVVRKALRNENPTPI